MKGNLMRKPRHNRLLTQQSTIRIADSISTKIFTLIKQLSDSMYSVCVCQTNRMTISLSWRVCYSCFNSNI